MSAEKFIVGLDLDQISLFLDGHYLRDISQMTVQFQLPNQNKLLSLLNETVNLKAAEMVAFDVLQPALRSRGREDKAGKDIYIYADTKFKQDMVGLIEGKPTGAITFLTLTQAIQRIEQLEKRLKVLEGVLRVREKITSHYQRPFIPLSGVPKTRHMPDIP